MPCGQTGLACHPANIAGVAKTQLADIAVTPPRPPGEEGVVVCVNFCNFFYSNKAQRLEMVRQQGEKVGFPKVACWPPVPLQEAIFWHASLLSFSLPSPILWEHSICYNQPWG